MIERLTHKCKYTIYGGLITKSCPTFETQWIVARQAPLFMGILQAGILEWVAISFSNHIYYSTVYFFNLLTIYLLTLQITSFQG